MVNQFVLLKEAFVLYCAFFHLANLTFFREPFPVEPGFNEVLACARGSKHFTIRFDADGLLFWSEAHAPGDAIIE